MATRGKHRVTEADVLAVVTARWGRQLDSRVLIGPGDDCAVLSLPRDKQTVITTDLLIEGVHFSPRSMLSHWSVGWKALAVSVSDVFSMGARPRWAVGSLGIPPGLTGAELEGLLDGVNACAEQFAVTIVGGDTVAARDLTIGFTLLGELKGEPLLRSGARPGQLIWHNGLHGVSQVGLHAMWGRSSGQPDLLSSDSYRELAERAHCTPIPSSFPNASNATAALDTSDSLAQSLIHLARASNVGLRLDFRNFAFDEAVLDFATGCRRHSGRSRSSTAAFTVPGAYDPSSKAQRHGSLAAFLLAASEDYGMLYTSPATTSMRDAHSKASQLLGRTVAAGQGYRYIDETGAERELTELGWKHG